MSLKQHAPEAYELLDQRDEDQILAEIKGNIISEMFYSFPLDGKTVTGVSWVGTKEIARQYGCIDLDFVRVDDTEDSYIAVVKATDTRTGTSLLGTAMQPKNMTAKGVEKPDRFAYTKAVSKAQRNAIRAIIPERFLLEMYEAFKKSDTTPRVRVRADAVVVEPNGKPNTQPPGQFDLKSISWKVKGGDIVTGEIPIWGTTFAQDTKGDYHTDIRGDLVRYLEYNQMYVHHEAGEAWEVTLNEWQGNTFINVRKQKNGKGSG